MLRFAPLLACLLAFSAHATTLKIATLYPDGTSVVNELKAASDTIAQRTGDRVRLRIYPGGVMGDDRTVQRKIAIGQLHGFLAQSGALADAWKDSQVLNLPLVFRDYDEVDHVRRHLDPVIRAGLEEHGWVTFGGIDGGFAYIMSRNPVSGLDALRQQKLWLPANDSGSARAAEVMGLSPVVLNIGTVLTSLQTGVIDAFVAPPVAALTLQWHSRVQHLTDLPLLYTWGTLAISDRHFRQLPEADRQVVREVLEETFTRLDARSREENLAAFEAVRKQGLALVKPSAEELAEWRRYSDRAIAELVEEGEISQQMLDRLRALLAGYRAGSK